MADNDNSPAPPPATAGFRMVPLIGAIHDDGRFERFEVVELLRVPLADLRADVRRGD